VTSLSRVPNFLQSRPQTKKGKTIIVMKVTIETKEAKRSL
jgi:hypothetical protein